MFCCPICETPLLDKDCPGAGEAVEAFYKHDCTFDVVHNIRSDNNVCVCGKSFTYIYALNESGFLYHLTQLSPEEAADHRALMFLLSLSS